MRQFEEGRHWWAALRPTGLPALDAKSCQPAPVLSSFSVQQAHANITPPCPPFLCPPTTAAVVTAMEPMLQRTLGLQVTDALLLTHQARGLEAFAKIFGPRPDLAAPAVAR